MKFEEYKHKVFAEHPGVKEEYDKLNYRKGKRICFLAELWDVDKLIIGDKVFDFDEWFSHSFVNLEKKIKSGDVYVAEPYKEDNPDLNNETVPVDDMFCEMMNWAVRYALGRRTYAASDTAGYMMRVLKLLDDQTIYVMLRDIEEQEKIGNLGHECDAAEWMKLKEAIQKEIERRKNGDH